MIDGLLLTWRDIRDGIPQTTGLAGPRARISEMTATIFRYKPNGERDYYLEQIEREAAELRARPVDGELWAYIFCLPIRALAFVLFLPVRYGYGKQYLWALLFLFFVAPVTLFVGAFVLGVHAHPQAFLAFWQTYVIRHPGAASWTWAIRGFTDLCRW
ncbi:hypothetical protein F6A13_06845 [Acidithiobacillus sp. 'AMD consortium']|uniref:Uncharacterized protein n=2 Tax=Acidithiobacillaceae TaxID=225058 RepID=A0A2W1KFI4_ACIFR|nr:hypothetical protein [Acidithiobacillus ferrooxidans]QFG78389.1 hypothetical protein F6A13_06845 [Acidithiobacillus sp. 'AMD consortium']PZD81215.1 hypothetical protein DN052_07955 [Acidithiobacillus ferrooxidans]QLK42692.1 hypothetical protein FE661_11465 [Acidithiobacillus ferrooxidans]QZT51786.1 hypothetical protein K7B00_11415 [Acidithiobacillus ferrooxidans]